MEVRETQIPDVKLIIPKVWKDNRGYFFESFNSRLFADKVSPVPFVQDNESWSKRGTLRGLHYQLAPYTQSKLVRVVSGRVLDVSVDIRKGSPTFGQYVAVELSDSNHHQLYVPRGFAHGFVVLSDEATFQYKVDNYYSSEHDRGIRFDDRALGIDWGLDLTDVNLSDKDRSLPSLDKAEVFSFEDDLYGS